MLVAPSFVPETMKAMDLLRSFLTHSQGLAIVVDEFGGTEGIITLSDIIEEIMSDAAPLGDADLYIEPLEDGRFLVSGNARLDDLSEHLGFELEADGIDTIGGFVFNRLGYLPPSGTRFEMPRLAITVRRAGRKRIEEILLEKTACLRRPNRTRRQRSDRTMIYGLAILLLWTVSFFFAGIEAGLLSVDPVRLRHHVKQGTPARPAPGPAARSGRSGCSSPSCSSPTSPNILGLLLLDQAARRVASATSDFSSQSLIALPIYLFVLGVLPKSLFRRFPFRALAALGGVLECISIAALAGSRNRGARSGASPSPPCQRERPPLYRARRIETDRRAKRARRLPHLDRARHDPQRRRFPQREGVRDVMVPIDKAVTVAAGHVRRAKPCS